MPDLNSVSVKSKAPYKGLATACIYGDSISTGVNCYAHISANISGLRVVKNAGVGGDDTTQMLARFNTDVAPFSPDVVFFQGGTNDIGRVEYNLATTLSNILEINTRCRNIGAILVLALIPPRNDYALLSHKLRFALQNLCEENGIYCVDPFSTFIDNSTGLWIAGMSADGVHPLPTKIYDIGLIHSQLCASILTGYKYLLPTTNSLGGLSTNALMLTDTNADGIADGWSGTLRTSSLVVDSDFVGKAQAMATDGNTFLATFTMGAIPVGKTHRIVGKAKIISLTGATLDIWAQYLANNTRAYVLQNCEVVGNVMSFCVDITNTDASPTTAKLICFSSNFAGADTISIRVGQFQQYEVD